MKKLSDVIMLFFMLRSDESVTAGSSDENANNHQEQGSARKLSFGQMLADASSKSNTTGENPRFGAHEVTALQELI
ncbi:G-box-binding factor 1-like [Raphanus sativus]|uniref:G-box-binding factor 1-like n=1 Tax=Raphanus sativus TaxID=3726 RepID=A0A9W3DQ69_RAPSA|nr:G-box-binding factor 1-like [Raphanus sativus]